MSDVEYSAPTFNRSELIPGAVLMGFGAFSSSHGAYYFNRAAENGVKDLGIIAVVPSARQELELQTLAKQDNIYHLIKVNGSKMCQRIDVICNTIIGALNPRKVVETLASDTTRLVNLTISGDGYFPEITKPENLKVEQILKSQNNDRSALRRKHWHKMQTPIGWIVAGLYKRYEQGKSPFIVMSCDNLPKNGDKTEKLIRDLAELTRDKGFVEYIKTQVLFPNTAVDRIAPEQDYATQSKWLLENVGDKAIVQTKNGPLFDTVPRLAEAYGEWVIENKDGRLPPDIVRALEGADVHVVKDIQAYQDRKIVLLNGAHMWIGVAGMILQTPTVHAAMADKEIRKVCDLLQAQGAKSISYMHPHMEDLGVFVRNVVERFENKNMPKPDVPSRLVSATHTKIRARFLHKTAIENGLDSTASAFAIATWLRYIQNPRNVSNGEIKYHASDVGIADKLCLEDHRSAKFPNNLCRYLTDKNLVDASPEWKRFIAQVVSYTEDIHKIGLRAAINAHFTNPKEPALRTVAPTHQPT